MVSTSHSLGIVGYIDRDYRHKPIATTFLMMLDWYRPHTLAENVSLAVDRKSAASHSTSSKQYALNLPKAYPGSDPHTSPYSEHRIGRPKNIICRRALPAYSVVIWRLVRENGNIWEQNLRQAKAQI